MLNWLLSAVLMAGAVPTGTVTIKTPDLQVLMSPQTAFTAASVSYGGDEMILPRGGQGALVGQGSKWFGGTAATEPVSTFDIKADQIETDLKGNVNAGGETTTIHKESTILTFKHVADTTISKDLILQRHQFEATEDLDVGNFYSFVYSFSPKAKNWLAQPVKGDLLKGEFANDKGQKPNQPVLWMAQYDPQIKKGVLLYYQQPMTGPGAFNAFWDTENYHKAFAQPAKGIISKGTKFDLTMAMQFFTAEPDQWEAKVKQLAPELQGKYPQKVTQAPPAPRLYDEGVPEDGIVTLKTDHYTVPFRANQAWTIYEISFDDKLISHHNGYHGTVMIPKGSNFVGTGHSEGGREIVHSVTVKVDDKAAVPITEQMIGTTLTGHKLTVLKHSTIAKFDCTTEVAVTDDHVYERTTLDPKEPIELTCLYYFMHCFQPTTTKWAAELPDGKIELGDLDGTGGFRINKDTRWAAQYDPTTNLGYLCYTPKVISGPGSASMIWNLDKTRYHKYYLRYTTNKAFQPGEKLDYSVIVKAVPNETEDFSASKAAAAELAKQYPPVQ
jgi:hypothetical protein